MTAQIDRFTNDILELDQELIELRRTLREHAAAEESSLEELQKLCGDLRSRLPELKVMLDEHAQMEEEVLFPRAQSVLGKDLDEINVLRDEQKVLQWRLDKLVEFVEQGPCEDNDADLQQWFNTLRGMCDAMATTFDAHTMHSATFFNINHDLLFPGKVFTG